MKLVIFMELSKRKQNRLSDYDYSTSNAYFITICTANRRNLFWDNPHDISLSMLGEMVRQSIEDIPKHYPVISVDTYVVMPNHIHLLLQIHTDCNGRPMAAPTISTVMNQMKGIISKKAGFPVWQKGVYDHVVRGETDYREIWNYIEGNPYRWSEDELFGQGVK